MLFIYRPDLSLIKSIIAYQNAAKKSGGINFVRKRYAALRHRFWSLITGSDIDRDAKISPDLKLPHPTGVVIHQDAKIGPGCMIMQQVTLGQLATGGAPIIGSGVYIGAGAKLLGEITIGDNARIGANAVVLCDLPPNSTAVGVPARIIQRE